MAEFHADFKPVEKVKQMLKAKQVWPKSAHFRHVFAENFSCIFKKSSCNSAFFDTHIEFFN